MLSDERIRQIAAETVASEDWYNFPADAVAHGIRAALTEQAATHALELRAYEATVANLEQRIRELEAEYEQRLAPLKMELECIAEQLNDPRENLTHSTAQCIASLQERIRQLELLVRDGETHRVPDELRANLIVGCDEITSLCRYLRHGGCDSSDLSGLEEGLTHAIDMASEMISMLAAAPAPKEGE
jgi:predicted RNase H-like nuclease (RuvC/YqgF family)